MSQVIVEGDINITLEVKRVGIQGRVQPSVFANLVVTQPSPFIGIPLDSTKSAMQGGIGLRSSASPQCELEVFNFLSGNSVFATKVGCSATKIHNSKG